ncbi:class I SAM-dependent methyltransferase [Amycolatopsis lurida]
MSTWLTDTRTSYDTVADDYASQLRDAVAGDAYLRGALATFAEQVREGPVADIGCGPGHVTAHLAGLGVDAFGIDLSPAMIEVARRDHPGLRFEVGSMTELDLAPGSVGGVLAWWSLIHIPDDEIPLVLGHFRRVLRPGGPLLVPKCCSSRAKAFRKPSSSPWPVRPVGRPGGGLRRRSWRGSKRARPAS